MNITENTPIQEYLKRPKKTQLTGLKQLGIHSILNLLYHFPSRYADAAMDVADFDKSSVGDKISISGTIEKINKRRTMGSKRMMITEAIIISSGKKVKAVWFHQPYIANQYSQGDNVKVIGKVSGGDKPYMTNPIIKNIEIERESEEVNVNALEPVYPETRNISSLWIRYQIERLFEEEVIKNMEDPIPLKIRESLNLPDIYHALKFIHTPKNSDEHQAARKRFIFEKTFIMQLSRHINKQTRLESKAHKLKINKKLTDEFIKDRFEFTPTKAQKNAIEDILKDIQTNKPMARLIEGDVGSGKTAVAAAVMHSIVSANEDSAINAPQVAYLAPTEVLAKQQFNALLKLFEYMPIQIGLILGKECVKYPSKVDRNKPTRIPKSQIKREIKTGEISIIVGTHAVIQKDVSFRHLALAIIDEQHRFGVAQRQSLISEQGEFVPHLLSMTATPIPRTLALTIYGDLDISVIDELPKGRKNVQTKLLESKNIQMAYDHIRKEIEEGRQAYVLCPRVEESDMSNLRSVEEEYEHLSKKIFPELSIGKLYGKMKPKEKQEVMEEFAENKIQVLVCTTVIEVGVNVPNATIITILHAERFGLAQLHQLRGRVVRSTYQSQCYAITDSSNEVTNERLKIFEEIHNGFELARKDLDMRGSGEIAGVKQSGIPDLVMEGLKNPKLVEIVQKEVKDIIKNRSIIKKTPALERYIQSESTHNE